MLYTQIQKIKQSVLYNFMSKIFQIGFNKCGTSSIFYLFNNCCSSGLRCVHWDKGNIAKEIHYNVINNKKPILGCYEDFDVFTDMEYYGHDGFIMAYRDYYKALDRNYAGSRFILNIRSVRRWLRSRLRHYGLSSDRDKVLRIWEKDWHEHISDVLRYFSGRDNLLIFDIENDDFGKFRNFFSDLNFTVDKFPWKNKGGCFFL